MTNRDSLIHPHQKEAMGMGYDLNPGDFGVGSLEGGGAHVKHMDADGDTDHSRLGDGERSQPVRHSRRKMHREGPHEHGPHHMNSGHKPVKLGGRGGMY